MRVHAARAHGSCRSRERALARGLHERYKQGVGFGTAPLCIRRPIVNPDGYRDRLLAGSDGVTLTAVDVTTGEVAWTAPFLAIDFDADALVTGKALEPYGDGWIFSSDLSLIHI